MAAFRMTRGEQLRRALANNIKQINLTPVKKVKFEFDPFHARAGSIRKFMFTLSAERCRTTNLSCVFKYDVKSDQSLPVVNVQFNDGNKALFKTENLSELELIKVFNQLCHEKIPEDTGTKY